MIYSTQTQTATAQDLPGAARKNRRQIPFSVLFFGAAQYSDDSVCVWYARYAPDGREAHVSGPCACLLSGDTQLKVECGEESTDSKRKATKRAVC